jgi:hypothetical protein
VCKAEKSRTSGGRVFFLSIQQRPSDARRFVGERHNRSIETAPSDKCFQPGRSMVVMLGQSADDGACTVDQLAPEIVVGASADAAEPWLAASRILSRHQPDPCCHLATRAKLLAVVDGSNDRCGDDRADARQLGEPPAGLIRATEADNRRVELFNPTIEVAELV